jgi:hypothetical protein
MDKFDAQLVLYKGMFTGETVNKMQKKLDTVENNIKALKQIEMINPLHILEMEKCNTLLSQFKELIQSVSAENICEECPFHSKNHKTIRIDDHCTDCGCLLEEKWLAYLASVLKILQVLM